MYIRKGTILRAYFIWCSTEQINIITDREVLSVSIVIGVVAVGFFSAAMVDTPYSKI